MCAQLPHYPGLSAVSYAIASRLIFRTVQKLNLTRMACLEGAPNMPEQPWFAKPEERQRRLCEQRERERNMLKRVIRGLSDLEIVGNPLAWGDRIELTYRIQRMNCAGGE